MSVVQRHPKRNGFSLIEMLVVLLLIGILVAATVLSLQPHLAQARLQSLQEAMYSVDKTARRQASQSRGPLLAKIDLDKQLFALQSTEVSRRARATRGAKIAAVRFGAETIRRGQVEISYDENGHSATFAILLETDRLRRWFVVLGDSGQITTLPSDAHVEQILTLQTPTSP